MAKTAKVRLHPSKNPLSENVRGAMVELLQKHLASAIDLGYQCKQAHWNVKGMNFIAVHELFDKLHEQTEGFVDTIAERLTALGGQAHGTVQAAAEGSLLDPYPLDLVHSEGHLKRLADSFSKMGGAVEEAVDEAEEAGDALTADLFTEVGRGLDESLYFLESHFQLPDVSGRTGA